MSQKFYTKIKIVTTALLNTHCFNKDIMYENSLDNKKQNIIKLII